MTDDADTDDENWRFSVDEVGPDADDTGTGQRAESVDLDRGDVPEELVDDDEDGGNVAGTLSSVRPIEPETPTLENALFVIVGVYIGVFGIAAIVPGFLGSLQNVLLLAGGVLVLALLSLGFFGALTPDT